MYDCFRNCLGSVLKNFAKVIKIYKSAILSLQIIAYLSAYKQ